MYLYIESSACLHSHYFPTFRSLSVSLSAFLVFNAVHITACYHFSLYEYLRFANVWSHFAYLSLISFTPPPPPRAHLPSPTFYFVRSLSLSFSFSIYHLFLSQPLSTCLTYLSLFTFAPHGYARVDTYRRWVVDDFCGGLSRARALVPLSSSFRLYFYKNSRIHVRNKNAWDFEKTYERETILPVLISNLQQIFGNLLFLKSSLWNTLSCFVQNPRRK